MKKIATAAAAAALAFGLGASATASAQNLQGSDTLFNIMTTLIDTLVDQGDIVAGDITYIGGGSGTGQTGILNNTQEIGPMSRFYNGTACSTAPDSAGCWRVGKDLLSVFGNQGQACENGLTWDQTITVTERNGEAGLQCPGCTGASGDQFTFGDWRTVLRVIYAGQHLSGTGTTPNKVCNSDVRHSLVASWGNLFKDGCANGACAAGLRRAYRRDEASGTTDTFLELLQLQSSSNTPFCNGTERQDNDPIRRACDGTGFNGAGEEVCRRFPSSTVGNGYSLGLVLPVLIPQNDAYGAGTGAPFDQNCGVAALGGAAAGPVAWTLNDVTTYGSTCPNGTPQVGGTCLFPKRAGSAPGTGFGCIAGRNDRPAGSAGTVDARIYNLWTRNNDGSVKTYTRGASQQRANVSYFRNHQKQCTFADATDQIGCFVKDDACSIGFAGTGALSTNTDIIGLGLKSTVAFDHDGMAGTPNQFATVYPVEEDFSVYGLARFLYVCTYDDFANTGAQAATFVTAQQAIRDAIVDPTPDEVHDAVESSGFIPIENSAGESIQLEFEACP